MKRKEGDFHASQEESHEEKGRSEKESHEEVRRQEEKGLVPITLFDLVLWSKEETLRRMSERLH